MRKGGSTLLEGSMPEKQGDSCRIALEGRGNAILAYVDGELAGSYIDTDKPYLMGRVFLGSAWAETYFDNLRWRKSLVTSRMRPHFMTITTTRYSTAMTGG